MQLKLALLIVGIYFITMTSQRKDDTQYYIHKKKCDDEHISFRIRIFDFVIKVNQFFGLPTPIKKKICETTTTTVPTIITTSTTTSTTTIPTTTVTTTTVCGSIISLVTLYRLFNPMSDDHFYTASLAEANNAVITYGYLNQMSPGLVATSTSDCLCGATLKPVYRLYGPGDHFYTIDEAEALGAVSNYGYVQEGIAFYCSDQLGYCGATLPLYRYQRNSEHFYTTDPLEAVGTYEGITCYIWPG